MMMGYINFDFKMLVEVVFFNLREEEIRERKKGVCKSTYQIK